MSSGLPQSQYDSVTYISGSQTGVIFLPREHLETSGDILIGTAGGWNATGI